MDDLFEQLKAAPPVNKNIKPPKLSSPEDFVRSIEDNTKSSPRRESLPSALTPIVFKPLISPKSRSVSPPKFSSKTNNNTKPLKVLVGRKKLSSVNNNTTATKNDKRERLTPTPSPPASEKIKTEKVPTKNNALFELFKQPKNILTMATSTPTSTPTKAQQKEFVDTVSYDLLKSRKSTPLKMPQNGSRHTRRCVVRLPRQNLKQLKKHYKKKVKSENGKLRSSPSKSPSPQKRKNAQALGSPPSKRGRPNATTKAQQDTKPPNTAFFIKLSPSTTNLLGIKVSGKKLDKPIKLEKPEKTSPKQLLKTSPKNSMKKLAKPASKKSPKQRIKSPVPLLGGVPSNNKSSFRIKPTKFTRTQLIKAFGKRVFSSHVRIEKCRHPLMLIFDSNERARRLQAKNSKNKNLSVSFRDQVEVFGSSDESGDDDHDNDKDYRPKITDSKKSTVSSSESSSVVSEVAESKVIVTPARLKKVENGKVIDDIEFDPVQFIGASSSTLAGNAVSSTPFSPGRKRREKKSFSPLKGDATPSPRKEQFKLANEKLPPSYLRRLNIDDVDDDDDEDDECEYIVPIEVPQRRTSSRASSTNANESSSSSVSVKVKVSVDTPSESVETSDSAHVKDIIKETTTDESSPSKLESIVKVNLAEGKLEVLPKLTKINKSLTSSELTMSAEMLANSSQDFESKIKESTSENKKPEEVDRLTLSAYSKSQQDKLVDLFEKNGNEEFEGLVKESENSSDDVADRNTPDCVMKESVEEIKEDVLVVPISSSETSIKLTELDAEGKDTINLTDD